MKQHFSWIAAVGGMAFASYVTMSEMHGVDVIFRTVLVGAAFGALIQAFINRFTD